MVGSGGWRRLTLSEIALGGLFSDGDWVESKDQDPAGSVRLTQLADVGVATFRDRSSRWMREDQAAALRCTYLEPGDILIARMPDPLGRACMVGSGLGRAVTAVDVAILRIVRDDIDPRYVMWGINSPQFHSEVVRYQSGTTRKRISRKNLAALSLPVPPLPVQRRIVDILEDTLSRLNAARSAIGRCQVRLGRLRQAMLASVVSLAKVAEGSEGRSVADIAVVGTGATPLRARRDYYEGGKIPWVTSGDLAQGLIQKPTQFVTPKALSETNLKLFPSGTLLVAMYGEGKTRGTVGELAVEATTNQACAAIKLHNPDPLYRAWVRLVLEANYWNMRRLASGGVQPNLNLSLVRQMRVPLPEARIRDGLLRARDTQEQARRQLEFELRHGEQREQGLRRALLRAAFLGRLTGRSSDMDLVEEMAGV